jgi:hypothetical protein
MRQSENITNLLMALLSAQAEYPTLPKDKKGYGYNYTDLDTVITTIKPIFIKNKLGFMQSLTTLDNGKNGLTTRIFNEKGEWIEDTIALPDVAMAKTNAAQNVGAAITYMRRYALCSILGISSDEDVDAEVNQQQTSKLPQKQTTPKQTSKLPQKQTAPKQTGPALAGGPDTPDENKKINELLSSMVNGQPVFSPEDKKQVAEWRRDYTAAQVIQTLEEELKKRTPAIQKPLNNDEIMF